MILVLPLFLYNQTDCMLKVLTDKELLSWQKKNKKKTQTNSLFGPLVTHDSCQNMHFSIITSFIPLSSLHVHSEKVSLSGIMLTEAPLKQGEKMILEFLRKELKFCFWTWKSLNADTYCPPTNTGFFQCRLKS